MTDTRIDRPEETKTQTKKYYKSKYCFSLHLPKDLEEKVKDAAESEARNVTSYITSLILKDLKEKKLVKWEIKKQRITPLFLFFLLVIVLIASMIFLWNLSFSFLSI